MTSRRNFIVKADPKAGSSVAVALAMVCRTQLEIRNPQSLCVCATYESAREMFMFIQKIAKRVTTGLLISDVIESLNSCHIIIGTPKEMATLVSSGNLITNNIGLLLFEDADVTASTDLVKRQILEHINCQTVAISSVFTGRTIRQYEEMFPNANVLHLDSNRPLNKIINTSIECREQNKNTILMQILGTLKNENAKAVIFCNVRF